MTDPQATYFWSEDQCNEWLEGQCETLAQHSAMRQIGYVHLSDHPHIEKDHLPDTRQLPTITAGDGLYWRSDQLKELFEAATAFWSAVSCSNHEEIGIAGMLAASIKGEAIPPTRIAKAELAFCEAINGIVGPRRSAA